MRVAISATSARATDDTVAAPRVLMVTGAYYPESSGGGLQARGVIRALRGAAHFSVLTTSTDPGLPAHAVEEGVPIRRVYVDPRGRAAQFFAAWRLGAAIVRGILRADVINLHGFSRKAIPLVAFSRVFGKRFVLTLQTGGYDEPAAARAGGVGAYWAYTHADAYLSVSPGLTRAYLDAGLPAERLRQVCNAVDVERFAPLASDAKRDARRGLGLPPDVPLVMYVGFFSADKRPELFYNAWRQIASDAPSAIVFVGATRPRYREVDPMMVDRIRRQIAADGLSDRVFFVESTTTIERYFQAANIYVLPSIREGLPLALLEAMASGLACVATRLPGSTDSVIDDGRNGLLVEPDDERAFASAIRALILDLERAARLGSSARETVVERYSIQKTAPAWLAVYRELASCA